VSRTPFDDPEIDMNDTGDTGDTVDQQQQEPGGIGEELQKLRAERDDLYTRLARTTADFQNARRRLEGDKEQAVQFANSSLIKSLLPVIDNFERALTIDPAKIDVPSLLKGMQIVHDQWLAMLAKEQVQPLAPEPGTPFDPTTMQALMQQADDRYKNAKEPIVTQLLQKGYALHGRTLRPAQVAVSKTT